MFAMSCSVVAASTTSVVNANPFFFVAIFSLAFFLAGLLLGRRWVPAKPAARPAARPMPRPSQGPRPQGRGGEGGGGGMVELYVGNLPEDASSNDVTELFSRFGKVQNVRIITNRESGESKGFGFIEMPNAVEAEAAIRSLNGKDYKGHDLVVNAARSNSGRRRRRPRR